MLPFLKNQLVARSIEQPHSNISQRTDQRL
jgi:hypothetical protein